MFLRVLRFTILIQLPRIIFYPDVAASIYESVSKYGEKIISNFKLISLKKIKPAITEHTPHKFIELDLPSISFPTLDIAPLTQFSKSYIFQCIFMIRTHHSFTRFNHFESPRSWHFIILEFLDHYYFKYSKTDFEVCYLPSSILFELYQFVEFVMM